MRRLAGLLIALCTLSTATPATASRALTDVEAGRFAALALACVHQEYPNKIAHALAGDADAKPPRELTPAFYGCYDWHSAVHGHWLLARLLRLHPEASFAPAARAALAQSLTPSNIAVEVAYLQAPGRASFERPYGLAWLLALAAELRASPGDPDAREWLAAIEPLEAAATVKITTWLPKLNYPIRTGEHNQTAFSFGLIHDWARSKGDAQMLALLRERAHAYYGNDRSCPLGYEPSGEDFLSACLAEADFMRRELAPGEYAKWLQGFLPQVPRKADASWLAPGIVTDRKDPKLAHIDGLNLSRAWMLRGIAAGLSANDPRRGALLAAADAHAVAALPAVTGEHYEGGHWLGTFAVYLLTQQP